MSSSILNGESLTPNGIELANVVFIPHHATALSLALNVFSFQVRRIRENISNQRSALRDVFDPLAEPFFAAVLTDDYEVVGTKDQEVADENVASFPIVDDAELNIPQSTFAVLSVGMSISAGMTASVPEFESIDNVVPNKFLDLNVGDGCNQFCFNPLCEVVNSYYQEFDFPSHGPRKDILQTVPLSMTNRCDLRLTALAFFTSAGMVSFVSFSTNTCLLKCAKLVDAILLSASAFLFSLLGTCLFENVLNLLSISEFHSFGFVSINPAPEPYMQDDLSVNKIYGSGSSSSTSIRVSGESSSSRSSMNLPVTSALDNICSIDWSVITMIGCA
uniref:Uncharacterized protein n=1 Tax=Tanacetum cinerariifolium TaxID=118510 RepID=A0A6L2JAU5_TANCI|nr:hypothetical protein [Tanacetum cinerariifolium]